MNQDISNCFEEQQVKASYKLNRDNDFQDQQKKSNFNVCSHADPSLKNVKETNFQHDESPENLIHGQDCNSNSSNKITLCINRKKSIECTVSQIHNQIENVEYIIKDSGQ